MLIPNQFLHLNWTTELFPEPRTWFGSLCMLPWLWLLPNGPDWFCWLASMPIIPQLLCRATWTAAIFAGLMLKTPKFIPPPMLLPWLVPKPVPSPLLLPNPTWFPSHLDYHQISHFFLSTTVVFRFSIGNRYPVSFNVQVLSTKRQGKLYEI